MILYVKKTVVKFGSVISLLSPSLSPTMLDNSFDTPADWATNQAQTPEEFVNGNDLDQYIMASLLTELNELRQRQKRKDDGDVVIPDVQDGEGSAVDCDKENTCEENHCTKEPATATIETYRPVPIWEKLYWLCVLVFLAWPLATIFAPLFVAWQPFSVFCKHAQNLMDILIRIIMFPTRCAENVTGRRSFH